MKSLIFWAIGIVISLICGIAVGSFFSGAGFITWLIGGFVFFGVLGIFLAIYIGAFAGNALFNLATQHERDAEILEELKKANEEKLSKE